MRNILNRKGENISICVGIHCVCLKKSKDFQTLCTDTAHDIIFFASYKYVTGIR